MSKICLNTNNDVSDTYSEPPTKKISVIILFLEFPCHIIKDGMCYTTNPYRICRCGSTATTVIWTPDSGKQRPLTNERVT